MKSLLIVLVAGGLLAQTTPTLTVLNANPAQTAVKPGDAITLNLSLSGTAPLAGLEWSVTTPAGFVFTTAAGAQANAAAKQVQCNQLATKQLCVLYGLNQTILADGIFATINTTVPTAATNGTLTFALADAIGSDPNGTGIAVGAAVPFTLPIVIPPPISPCDLNGDGKTDGSDVTISVSELLGLTSGTNADLNQDGKVTVTDVYRVIVAVLTGVCKVGP